VHCLILCNLVAVRNRPHLAGKPVAITHSSGGTTSTAEIASCNYIARDFGIKNGSNLGDAKRICPDLVTCPYEFDDYDKASRGLYGILMEYARDVQAVSCDEALIDVGHRVGDEALVEAVMIAEEIRERVKAVTGCVASVGIGGNILLAKIATRKAKPDGAFFLGNGDLEDVLGPCAVRELPGVGRMIERKLGEGVTCEELVGKTLKDLQSVCGDKIGTTLYNYVRGVDDRELENKERQSVGAEITWGIRFETEQHVTDFTKNLCDEISSRMIKADVRGRMMSIKLMKRLFVEEPKRKMLGHGHCENISRSLQLPRACNR
jgi:DNA repair protein REV1